MFQETIITIQQQDQVILEIFEQQNISKNNLSINNQQNVLQNLSNVNMSSKLSKQEQQKEVNQIVSKINQLEIIQSITESINSLHNISNKDFAQFDKVASKDNLIIQNQSSSQISINALTQRDSLSISSENNISTSSQNQYSSILSSKQSCETLPSSSRQIYAPIIQNCQAEPQKIEEQNIQKNCSQKINSRAIPYKIEKKIGDGCSAVVYLAKLLDNANDAGINNFVAVKKFKKRKEMHFEVEKDILQMINGKHPNIMNVQNINIPQMEIQSEYYSNGDILDFVIKRGALKESQARYFFKRICSAILYLKQNNICHRDLKLENILFDSQYNPIVIDFGFAALNRSNFIEFIGTEGYQPPEILQKQPYDGHSCDMFSLGVMLFEMVMGKPPFKEAKLESGLYKKLVENNEDYWEVFKKYSNPSKEAKDLLNNLLNKDQHKRITIEEVFQHPWMRESQPEEQILQ